MTKLIGDPPVPLESRDGDTPPRRTGALVALGLSTGSFVVLLPFSPLGAAWSGLRSPSP